MARACELLYVVTIPLTVPLQLGQSQVMSLKREEAETALGAGKHRGQPILVVFGRRGDGDSVEVDLVLSMQGGPLARHFHQLFPNIRHNAQKINVACGAGDTVKLRCHEAATAVNLNLRSK